MLRILLVEILVKENWVGLEKLAVLAEHDGSLPEGGGEVGNIVGKHLQWLCHPRTFWQGEKTLDQSLLLVHISHFSFYTFISYCYKNLKGELPF